MLGFGLCRRGSCTATAGGAGGAAVPRQCGRGALCAVVRHGPLWHQVTGLRAFGRCWCLALCLPSSASFTASYNAVVHLSLCRCYALAPLMHATCYSLLAWMGIHIGVPISIGRPLGCVVHAGCALRSCSMLLVDASPAHRSAYILWACHLLGCLLLPRLLPAQLVAALRGPSSGGSAGSTAGSGGNGVAAAVLRLLGSPLLALHEMSTMGIPWLLQVGRSGTPFGRLSPGQTCVCP